MPRSISSDEMTLIANKLLTFIRSEMLSKGYAPSVREIARATGIKSTATVHNYLNRLENMGLLRRDASKPRAIEILDVNLVRPTQMAPIVGQVTAGSPIVATENIVGHLPIPRHLRNRGEIFSLRVEGDSMIDAGIIEGDYLFVLRQNHANEGQIIVALIDNDAATVKYLTHDTLGRIVLEPANPSYDPIIPDQCDVLGVVLSLYRDIQ